MRRLNTSITIVKITETLLKLDSEITSYQDWKDQLYDTFGCRDEINVTTKVNRELRMCYEHLVNIRKLLLH